MKKKLMLLLVPMALGIAGVTYAAKAIVTTECGNQFCAEWDDNLLPEENVRRMNSLARSYCKRNMHVVTIEVID